MRRLFAFLILLAITWGGGFLWFMGTMPLPTARQAAQADGVVVLTGGGGERILTAMALIEKGVGARLLISGVNPAISRDQIAALWPGAPEGFDCCVDLGTKAETTSGNADEVRDWARQHNYKQLIVVTSDYHMRRALLELQTAYPEGAFTPHPVTSVFLDDQGRPISPEAWKILAAEYTKFLVVRIKTLLP